MAEESHGLLLEHLRVMRADVTTLRDDVREMRTRQAAVEDMFSFLVSAVTRMQHSLDRLTDRTERIEKPLGLIDQPAWARRAQSLDCAVPRHIIRNTQSAPPAAWRRNQAIAPYVRGLLRPARPQKSALAAAKLKPAELIVSHSEA